MLHAQFVVPSSLEYVEAPSLCMLIALLGAWAFALCWRFGWTALVSPSSLSVWSAAA